jgi:hypothetical protein
MKNITHIFLLFAMILITPLALKAQNDSIRKAEFTASINYQSRLNYFGRTDSLKSSGLYPSIGYQFKCGLYAQGNFIFAHNSLQPYTYAGSTIEAGYRFPQDRKITGNIFVTKFLYNNTSALVQSALQYQSGINLAFDNKILNINTGIDVKYGTSTDFGATFGLDHIFIFKIADKPMAFAFDPSAYVYLGTQKFSDTYVKKQKMLGMLLSKNETVNTTAFNVLSYEISAPIVFVTGKFNASLSPAFVMPQHLLTGERGSNMLYVTASVGVKL